MALSYGKYKLNNTVKFSQENHVSCARESSLEWSIEKRMKKAGIKFCQYEKSRMPRKVDVLLDQRVAYIFIESSRVD